MTQCLRNSEHQQCGTDVSERRRRPARLMLGPATLAALLCLVGCGGPGQQEDALADNELRPSENSIDEADGPRGLRVKLPEASPGYVLFTPLLSDTTYLIDVDGLVVHTWKSEFAPAGSVYLLDNGHLLRGAREPEVPVFSSGGQGGRLQEFTWDGELLWDWVFASEEHLLHHDVEPLPNGNVLAIAWEAKTADEAKRAGRRPGLTPEAGLWPDMLVEIEPLPPEGGRIVWEWHMWDHLIQNQDASAPNYGDPSAHPERIDINGDHEPLEIDPEELERLKALGYVPEDTQPEDIQSDLLHTNAVAYNAKLDQIVVSVRRFSEIWVIDHSTTLEEAAGHSGGRGGRGGDLLYRWGNPSGYGLSDEPQQLFFQHDVRWIPDGFPGAGHLTLFNNSMSGPDGDYSAVFELVPPTDGRDRYLEPDGGPFGPQEPIWTYQAPDKVSFYSSFISGAQRLSNGNTLICSGAQGRFLEVTAEGKVVWEYWDPHSGDVRMADGSTPHPVDENIYAVFRATKIAPDHPALAGRDLRPLDPQPPLAAAPGDSSSNQ